MATKRASKAVTPQQKKKGFLRKKFLKLPVWLWLIIVIFGIAGMSGEDSSNTSTNSATPTATVSASTFPEVTVDDSTEASSNEPTIEPTATPAVIPTVMVTPTPESTSTPVSMPTVAPTQDVTQFVIREGDKDENVRQLQLRLIALGFLSGKADGDFGPKTVSAVKAFQNAADLPMTGECDYDTYLSLKADNAPVAATQAPAEEEDVEIAYIGNRNSKKFHYPSCSSVDDMKEKNKVEFYSRDEAVNSGYDPCGRCHP